MRVWFLSHTFLPARGGIENYLAEASRRLLLLGHRPAILCRRHLPGLPEREARDGVDIFRHPDFPVPRRELPRKPRYLADRLARWIGESGLVRDGIAVCRFPHYGAALAAVKGAAPAVYLPAALHARLAGIGVRSGSLKERLFFLLWKSQIRSLEKKALNASSRVAVFSRLMADSLAREHGIGRERVEVNPPGVDAERFSPGRKDEALARSLGLPPGRPVVLALGRLSPEKNLPFLVGALASLLRSRAGALLVVGGGPLRPVLEAIGRERKLEGGLSLAGETDAPERYYRLADVFASPARYESFGQSILEAMASALPVLALRSAPPSVAVAAGEIVEDGRSGLLLPEDPVAWRETVARLLGDREPRVRMGGEGRRICRERFTWERHLAALLGSGRDAPPADIPIVRPGGGPSRAGGGKP